MSVLNEYLLFLTEKTDNKNQINTPDVAKAVGAGVITKKSLEHGLHRVFGLRGETHTTNRDAAKKIKQSDYLLDPKKGGTGSSKIAQDYVNQSKGKVHITGYNRKSYNTLIKRGLSPSAAKMTLKAQPVAKKFQRGMYRIAAQGKLNSPAGVLKALNPLERFKSKTFHVVGSEDFYNKNFIPDVDDVALTTSKKLKVYPSRLRATVAAIKQHGFKGLKSSPKMRPVIGASILTLGALSAVGLSLPLLKKIKNKYELKHVSDLVKSGKKEKAKQYLINKR